MSCNVTDINVVVVTACMVSDDKKLKVLYYVVHKFSQQVSMINAKAIKFSTYSFFQQLLDSFH
jgi:hypothetical protein